MIIECEIKIDGQWQTVDYLTAVTKYAQNLKRCPACGGRVTHYPSKNPHFGHYAAHEGCSLVESTFCGTPSKHRDALE
jgi:competence CoiA-like predicted nuclease